MRDVKRLRRLLDLRKRQEEQTRIQLARSLQKAAEISDEVRDRTQALERVLEGGEFSPRRRSHLHTLMEISEPAIRAAQAAEASAMAAAEEVRQEWSRAAMRLKGMERLEARAEAERQDRIDHATTVMVEDAATARGAEDAE